MELKFFIIPEEINKNQSTNIRKVRELIDFMNLKLLYHEYLQNKDFILKL